MITLPPRALRIDPRDNVAVALTALAAHTEMTVDGVSHRLVEPIAAKHKFACVDLAAGATVKMYGVVVGRTTQPVRRGSALTTENLVHDAGHYAIGTLQPEWTAPNVSAWQDRTFSGYHRTDGSVGTQNLWIVIPLVFCENRNIEVMRQSINRALGFDSVSRYERYATALVAALQRGAPPAELKSLQLEEALQTAAERPRNYPMLDGVRFLTHGLGCGGTRQDSQALCGLLAGYATHPNVAGVTVLSLGCQIAEVKMLEDEIARRNPHFDRPFHVFNQQKHGSETSLLSDAIRATILGASVAGAQTRAPAGLDKLTLGLECGGSDGFSGISVNPVIGATSDRVVALGGRTVLAEFPELCGAEQSLIDRCVDRPTAERFIALMEAYEAGAKAVGSGLHFNPSPGNIRDGLITDAIKSTGAAKKGGTSPIVDVLDYPAKVTKPGLSLLCTPGNDVESTTALAGAHCNLILFSTGLGTPTGNPVAPVIKLSSNSTLAAAHPEMIDFDAGPVIGGHRTIAELGDDLLGLCVDVASGQTATRADLLGQHDFLPWKRGVSL